MKKLTAKQKKIGKVMHEFKAGSLHSGKGGPLVKSPKQAIAIALSESKGLAKGGVWIKDAIKNPGALRKSLKVPAGEKIPASKLDKAAKSSNPTLAKRAVLAKTLRGFSRSK
jgi:hypothetical protein